MHESSIKNAAITRVGFDYQDLIGIELLIEFYRAPEKYLWVQLESEDDTFRSLDDVVAALPDGSFELTQVKFTPRPEKYLLDWEWLLEKKTKGTSRLQKWASSLSELTARGKVRSACLRTNRRPDDAFGKSLRGHFVEWAKIDEAWQLAVEAELGGRDAATEFFSSFEFRHSESTVDRFDTELRGRLVPTATTSEGWLLLLHQARRWASRRGEPEPDGRITHKHLTQIISRKKPQPLSQDLRIPEGYEPPNQAFHRDLMGRVTADTGVWALWGSPGRGKSTYLSYAVEQLRQRDVPTIRHHYFLSLMDSGDRNSFTDIASSLMDQMVVRYSDAVRGLEERPTELRKWITACADHFAEVGKPFVIVIDGLDHVMREYADMSQMNQLFSALLPCPPNATVLVGTQRISDEHLPLRLIQNTTADAWIEVPEMALDTVQRWIALQHKDGRVMLREMHSSASYSHELGAIGDAFYRISLGHPLHLIYSFEAMVRRGVPFSSDEIALLPSCPEGDIRKYYAGLWRDLSPLAKEIIHAIAGSGFRWTDVGLRRCFGPLDEIDHLLEFQRFGVAPFHGSLLAFARERKDHDATFLALLPRIVDWLEKEAPSFQRWGWCWIMKARNGNDSELLTNTTREWVVTSLVNGWPPDQIIEILARAEELAFSKGNYVRTTELRALKTRVDSGPGYQIATFGDFAEAAIRSADNLESVTFSADQLPSLGSDEIATLVKTVPDRSSDIIEQAFDELRHRVNLWIELRHHPDQDFHHLVQRLLEVAAIYPRTDVRDVLKFLKGFQNLQTRDNSFRTFVGHLRRERRADLLVAAAKALKAKTDISWRLAIEDALVVVAWASELHLSFVYRLRSKVSPLLSCWLHFHKSGSSFDVSALPDPSGPFRKNYEYGRSADVENYFVEVFFVALASSVSGRVVDDILPVSGWARGATQFLTKLAKKIATGRAQLSFAAPYYAAREIEPVEGQGPVNPEGVHYLSFVHALLEIAIRLHAIKSPAGRALKISAEDLVTAQTSRHWNEAFWMAEQIDSNLPLLERSLATAALKKAVDAESKTITVFNERAERWVELSKYALLYNLPAQPLLARAASCIVGYGWRKDPWIYEVLDSIEDVYVNGGSNVLSLLAEVVPVVQQITEFTDGKGTKHARRAIIKTVAQTYPERLIRFYAQHISDDDYDLAEAALHEHIKLADLSNPAGRALTKTIVEYADIATLRSRHDPLGIAAAEAQVRMLGGMPTDHDYHPSDTPLRPSTVKAPDPTKYKASEFARLVSDFADPRISFDEQRAARKTWLQHWVSKGRAKQALSALRVYFDKDQYSGLVDDILNDAFDISLSIEGRNDAYRWLVKAHIARRGWQTSYTSETEVLRRLRLAATHFSDKWRDYIRDTSDPAPYWKRFGYSFSLGFRYLVHFLLLVGEKDLATAMTIRFVAILRSDVSDQPIPPSPWFN